MAFRVQENAMKGSLEYVTQNIQTRELNRRRIRSIRSIDRNIKVNQFVWDTADRFLDAA